MRRIFEQAIERVEHFVRQQEEELSGKDVLEPGRKVMDMRKYLDRPP